MKTLTQNQIKEINEKAILEFAENYPETFADLETEIRDYIDYNYTEKNEEITLEEIENFKASVELYHNGYIKRYFGRMDGIWETLANIEDPESWFEEDWKSGIKRNEYDGYKYSPRYAYNGSKVSIEEIEADKYCILIDHDLIDCVEIGNREDLDSFLEDMEKACGYNNDASELFYLLKYFDNKSSISCC